MASRETEAYYYLMYKADIIDPIKSKHPKG